MHIFNGREHALKLDEAIKAKVFELGTDIKELAIILIGKNASSEKYVGLKQKYCEKMGIPCKVYRFDNSVPDEELDEKVSAIVADQRTCGIIIQVPLPRESLFHLLELIPEEKDLDLLSAGSREKFKSGNSVYLPPVVRAVDYFLKYSEGINLPDTREPERFKRSALIVGKGFLVGQPVSVFLNQKGFEVAEADERNLGEMLKNKYDLVILATGAPGLIKCEELIEGTNVIDFGSSVVEGKVRGDLDLLENCSRLGVVSPSPGGMGPLVIRFLVMNHLGI